MPPIVPVSYLEDISYIFLVHELHTTYPKRTPPKATNNPTRIAGNALPALPSGFFSIRPMVKIPFQKTIKDE
jgi:hypothetical protein